MPVLRRRQTSAAEKSCETWTMSMDWDDLRFFLAVARSGRLTAAAKRLGADHATVSRRVAALEAALQARLFERSPRGYALTEAGERLVIRAEEMESAAARMQSEIAGEKLSLGGAVRIGAPDGFGSFFLAPRLPTLGARHPDLEIQLVATPRIFSLSKREADIAVGLVRPTEGRLAARKLTDYRLHLYGAERYLAGIDPIHTVEDLGRCRIIGYIPDLLYSQELDYLPGVSPDLKPAFESSNLVAQYRAAQAGAGLCILPDFMAREDPALKPVLAEEIALTRTFWLIVHADLRDVLRIRTAAEFIAEAVEKERGIFGL
jgi:DNA-binding transcriptional LysR family regulator